MFKRKKRDKETVPVMTLSILSMESALAAHIWIMRHPHTGLYYSAGQMSCVRQVDLATFYGSEGSAERARSCLNARIGAALNVVNLYEHARELAGMPKKGEDEEEQPS